MSARPKNFLGQQIGVVTVIGQMKETRHGLRQWLCLCVCGTIRLFTRAHLAERRRRNNCTCSYYKETAKTTCNDLTGALFGPWEVIEKLTKQYYGRRETRYVCKCECGKQHVYPPYVFKSRVYARQCPHVNPKKWNHAPREPYPVPKIMKRMVEQVALPLWKVELALPGDRSSWVTEEYAENDQQAKQIVSQECAPHVVVSVTLVPRRKQYGEGIRGTY